MQVYFGLENYYSQNDIILTIGTFDGIHLGHQKIIKRLNQIAKEKQGKSAILSFNPHPRIVLNKDADKLKLLNSIDEKIKLAKKFGVDILFVLPFTEEFANQNPERFIENFLVDEIGIKHCVIGYDHKFGKNRAGNFELLKKKSKTFSFEVEEIPKQSLENIAISSTKIRKALQTGEIEKANQLLGYPYFIQGKVIEGDKIGRTLGFPTANISIENPFKLIPNDGIYAVKILVNDVLETGMLYIGNRPTLGKMQKVIEVNIFNFDENIYGKNLEIQLLKKIRNDLKLENLIELKNQIALDKKEVLDYFEK